MIYKLQFLLIKIFQAQNKDGQYSTYSGVLRNSKTGPLVSGICYTNDLETFPFKGARVPVEQGTEYYTKSFLYI